MYVKLIKDNQPVDYIENPKYVRWQKENKTFVITEPEEADGILSSNDTKIYQIKPSLGTFAGWVKVQEIEEEEYIDGTRALLSGDEEV